MPVLPDADERLIQFCELHAPVWAAPTPPIPIGVTPVQAASLAAKAAAARAALDAARAAREAAKAATMHLDLMLAALREEAAPLVASVKVAAARNVEVYSAAQIDPPRPRSPLPPPPTPTDVSARPGADGSVVVRFTAPRSAPTSGAAFRVLRSLTFAEGRRTGFVEVGGVTTERSIGVLVDATIPPGALGASYTVVGRRGRRESPASSVVSVAFPGAVAPTLPKLRRTA